MTLPADLRRLEVDLPACPRVLVELLSLLDEASPASVAAMAAPAERSAARQVPADTTVSGSRWRASPVACTCSMNSRSCIT